MWKGIEEMRKNEKAKIKIQKKYGYGRKGDRSKLRYPIGYEDENSEERKKLETKGIIYEVKLLDWIERIDIEADGNFIKTILTLADKKEWEKPTERDEIKINIRIYQDKDGEQKELMN